MGSSVNVEDSESNTLLTVCHCAETSAGSVLLVGQNISRDGDGGVSDIVCEVICPVSFLCDFVAIGTTRGLRGHFRGQLRVNHTAVGLESRPDATAKKAQQHLFFLRQLRKFDISIRSLTYLYRDTIESTLSRCITAWSGNCSAQDCKKLQKVVCTAQTITE
eukprot:g18671.t1